MYLLFSQEPQILINKIDKNKYLFYLLKLEAF